MKISLRLILLSPLVAFAQQDSAPSLDQCWENLQEADADGDAQLSPDEFVTFLQLMAVDSPDVSSALLGTTTFSSLDLDMKMEFATLACLCKDPSLGFDESLADVCCIADNANVRVPSSPMDLTYLEAVCQKTSENIYGASETTEDASSTATTDDATSIVEDGSTTEVVSSTPSEDDVTVYYPIFIKGGNLASSVLSNHVDVQADLVAAMNVLAQKVLDETLGRTVSALSFGGRRLQDLATVQIPTVISAMEEVACPSSISATDSDLCKKVTHIVTLLGSNDVSTYSAALQTAVDEGDLQSELIDTNPSTDAVVTTTSSEAQPAEEPATQPETETQPEPETQPEAETQPQPEATSDTVAAPPKEGGLSATAVIAIIICSLLAGTVAVSYCLFSGGDEEEGVEGAKEGVEGVKGEKPDEEVV